MQGIQKLKGKELGKLDLFLKLSIVEVITIFIKLRTPKRELEIHYMITLLYVYQ